ncbi:MAG: AMP-binding protein [Thermodesulfobacteriota bacterium]
MVYDKSIWLKSYDEGVRSEVEIQHESLPACFEEMRRAFAGKPAIHYLGVTLTFDQLLGHADRFAQCLADHGIGKGDVVAICFVNSPQYLIALVGGMKAGCAVTGISPLLTANEIAYQLKDSGAKALVVMDAIFQHRYLGIADQTPDVKLVLPTGILDFLPKIKQVVAKWLKKVPTGKITPVPGRKVLPFMEMLAKYPARPPEVQLTPEDPCFVQYTGGTTGVPKGAVCVHRNMLTNVEQWLGWLQVKKGQDLILSAFPMFHIAGLFTATCGLAYGITQVLIPNPRDTKHMVKEMNKYRPQWLANVPSLYLMLLKEPGFRALDFSDLGVCISGAAPFPTEGIRQFEEVVGAGKVIEVYGMTETCVLVTSNPRKGPKKIGTVGIPVASTEVKLVDIATGENEVPLGEEGEIIAHGPQIMVEYHNKPEETRLALREHDGKLWMHTGDIGRMDEDGYITIVDRKKDMVSVGGFKVFPRELEEKLYEHPAIDVCAILGTPNPERPETEVVKLVIQKSAAYADKPDEAVKEEILKFARESFAPYKVPKFVEFREIPLTAAGKVDKKLLR